MDYIWNPLHSASTDLMIDLLPDKCNGCFQALSVWTSHLHWNLQQLVPSWNCPFLHPPTMSSPHLLLTSILSASFIGVSFSRISSLTLSILYLWMISFTFLKIINKFLFPTLTSPSCFIYSTSVDTSVT